MCSRAYVCAHTRVCLGACMRARLCVYQRVHDHACAMCTRACARASVRSRAYVCARTRVCLGTCMCAYICDACMRARACARASMHARARERARGRLCAGVRASVPCVSVGPSLTRLCVGRRRARTTPDCMHTFQLETLANIIREKLLGTMPTDLAPCKSPALASNSFYR